MDGYITQHSFSNLFPEPLLSGLHIQQMPNLITTYPDPSVLIRSHIPLSGLIDV